MTNTRPNKLIQDIIQFELKKEILSKPFFDFINTYAFPGFSKRFHNLFFEKRIFKNKCLELPEIQFYQIIDNDKRIKIISKFCSVCHTHTNPMPYTNTGQLCVHILIVNIGEKLNLFENLTDTLTQSIFTSNYFNT